ncbi:hypothetical protein [Lysinibacter cavernae]|uniref:Uncharacterized protein n=1 Tax=Lysinibacter cavernae TaxID=1640652 RepID=A0A7X5TVD9_9MICO|nr:hypothetical protein [Lysinibacter cavernae]NIH54847.1 hypothetical protein [Lysinibacter cavernae]
MSNQQAAINDELIDGAREAASLNGLSFAMVSSTTSAVDPNAPTVFRYFEENGVLWGDYTGDTVLTGRFAGQRTGDTATIFFTHRSTDQSLRSGSATSVISRASDGALRLTEFYQFTPGKDEFSVCQEITQP